jgi:hypothetical protein
MIARRRWVVAAVVACVSCGSPGGGGDAPAPSPDDRILAELRRFEGERRGAADFAAAPPSERVLGADPYAIRPALPDRFLGLLRGEGALVLLDSELHELHRAAAPGSPSGLAALGDRAFVVGERDSEIVAYRLTDGSVMRSETIPLRGVRALRDIAVGPEGTLYAVEEASGRLLTIVSDGAGPGSYDVSEKVVGAGAFRVARTPGAVVVDCLLDHKIVAYRAGAQGKPEGEPAVIRNDGPLWSLSAIDDGTGVLIASGGAENRPLDRTHGSFENIDSFVYLDRIAWQPAPRVARLAEVNISDYGVVVPKALQIARGTAGLRVTVTGFGGEAFATIDLESGSEAPEVQAHPLPPGTNDFVVRPDGTMLIANPLLDEWIVFRDGKIAGPNERVTGPGDATRSPASRLGEALIFTELIAPWNRANGPLSRFTCETCHFEGYVDGRTHATGRGDVRATTKPLLGLFNNRPHFSRALDPDLSSVAHNEFRVAGARSNHEPVFDLKLEERPWLARMGVTADDLTALGLRRAFMAFLMDFSHRQSALTAEQTAFTADERRGAELFRDRCEGCHEARLESDVPSSRQPFEGWEAKVLSNAAPIVWGRSTYEKTGVVPYVHEQGARVPSLRRLYKKHPYFTNGAAKSIAEVLERARFGDGEFLHDGGGAPLNALSGGERAALQAFLRLL